MKKLFKITVAAAVAGSVLSQSAFAAQNYTISYEEAVKLAIQNSTSLNSLAHTYDNVKDARGNLGSNLGSATVMLPTGDEVSIAAVSDKNTRFGIISGLASIDGNLSALRENKAILEQATEISVLSDFVNITNALDNIALAEKQYAYDQQSLVQLGVKRNLGLASETAYEESSTTLSQSYQAIQTSKSDLEKLYTSLKNTLGVKAEDTLRLVFETNYEPLPADYDITAETEKAKATAESIRALKSSMEAAEKGVIYWSTTSGSTIDEAKANYETAKRNYNDALKAMDANMLNVYNNIRTLEANIETLKDNIKTAEEDIVLQKAKLDAGLITNLAYENNLLLLESAKTSLKTTTRTYRLLRFQLEHPSVLQ